MIISKINNTNTIAAEDPYPFIDIPPFLLSWLFYGNLIKMWILFPIQKRVGLNRPQKVGQFINSF